MVRGQVVVVQHTNLEDGVEGTERHVADGEEGDQLDGGVVLVVAGCLDEEGEEGERRTLHEEGYLRPCEHD